MIQSGQSQDYDILLKLLILGNSGVGKSCMLMRYADNSFTENFYNTIGVDFIWDTAGQDRFRTITQSYYRGAHGMVIVYDVTDKESFENVNNWINEISKYGPENVNKILVGNKSDATDSRKVSFEEGQKLAQQQGMTFVECSAKSSENIEQVFLDLTKQVIERLKAFSSSQQNDSKKIRLAEKSQPLSERQQSSCC